MNGAWCGVFVWASAGSAVDGHQNATAGVREPVGHLCEREAGGVAEHELLLLCRVGFLRVGQQPGAHGVRGALG
jgi:hypothetical protein